MYNVRGSITNILALLEDAVIWLFANKEQALQLTFNNLVQSAILTIVNQIVTSVFQRRGIHFAVLIASRKASAEPHSVTAKPTHTIDVLAFAVPVAKFAREEVKKFSFERVEVGSRSKNSNNAVDDYKKRNLRWYWIKPGWRGLDKITNFTTDISVFMMADQNIGLSTYSDWLNVVKISNLA